jgi:four helix bundle protein
MSHSYTDLLAWQKSIALVTDVYRETRAFPKDEIYGLTSQIRRAAISIPSNIAEGQGRASVGEFRQFLGTARGSLLELQTQITISVNLGYLSRESGQHLFTSSQEVLRILNGLMNSFGDHKISARPQNSKSASHSSTLSGADSFHSKLETRNLKLKK